MILAKTQLAVLTCNACNIQLFSRSGTSDEKLRALLIAEPKQDPAPEPEAKPAPAAAPVAAPATAAVPVKRPTSWGFFG